jgi:hypothetical protein
MDDPFHKRSDIRISGRTAIGCATIKKLSSSGYRLATNKSAKINMLYM